MERWQCRVAVVTGASAGIGAACCRDLLAKGMVVVGLARRLHRLEELKVSLPAEQSARFHVRQCDVSVEQQVVDAFAWVDVTLQGADVLVNNAGIIRPICITDEGNSEDLAQIINTNLMGVTWCTREAFRSMQRRSVNDGHVVIINSVAGHTVPGIPGVKFNMYAPSKHALTALTEVLRREFFHKGTFIKITSISPGVVDTEIFSENSPEKLSKMAMLRPEDVADAVSYCIQTPPAVQIHELIIKPVGESF
ncbi:hypothetical protein KR222_005859 [Zaprionus bogoriensis]|nr:hypothetical protein KR222_005859 [Zaprionus bogoriensis]